MRVAAVQLSSSAEQERNIAAAELYVRAAAADGARLILLPEKWPAMGGAEVLEQAAQQLSGPTATWASDIASELSIDLIAGSMTERRPGERKLFNTSLHIGPSGEVKAIYRKIHMFDVEIEGQRYRESDAEQAGDEIVVSEISSGPKIGMSICYDLRFPELYRILAVRGAEVIVVPAAFTLPTTRDHWEVLLRARAIENQAFVIAANQFGEHPGGLRSGGRSMIVDPWGLILAQAGDGEGYIVADLDLDHQRNIRASLPSLANRKPAAYEWPAQR